MVLLVAAIKMTRTILDLSKTRQKKNLSFFQAPVIAVASGGIRGYIAKIRRKRKTRRLISLYRNSVAIALRATKLMMS